jgi:hypothetical protein
MKLLTFAFIGCALVFGCSHNKAPNNAGPAQKAGATVDEGAHDVKESAKKAGHKVGEATEKAGDKLQEKTGN